MEIYEEFIDIFDYYKFNFLLRINNYIYIAKEYYNSYNFCYKCNVNQSEQNNDILYNKYYKIFYFKLKLLRELKKYFN